MELLNRLMALQQRDGALTDDALKALARELRLPLYRLEGLRSFYPFFRMQPGAPRRLSVCRDVACRMRAGPGFPESVAQALADVDGVAVEPVSCLGLCHAAPAALAGDVPVCGDAATLRDGMTGRRPQPLVGDPPAEIAEVDPYPGADARYGTLAELLRSGSPDAVIETLEASELRGMGGAGFPTGRKWRFTRAAQGMPRTVVCNADESEPGTFKDRLLLERAPHLVVEAMVIGGWVVGAGHGIIYLRHEYEHARETLEQALERARGAGMLGRDILGSGFDFELELFISPGGYIMGEETALLEGLEDKRGEPRNKPPFPTQVGYNGGPTLMNNVETFALIPRILQDGAAAWKARGRDGYNGLKFLSVSGDVLAPGVYCVATGTPIREVIEHAGGMAEGRQLYAFSPGGASTPFLPAERADTPVDFDALARAGAGLGSGALFVVGEGRDLLDLAIQQVRFFRSESCGKCVPCRVGSAQAVRKLEAAQNGAPESGLASLLEELDETLAQTSICGLGQVALTPIMSLLHHFPNEAARLRREHA
ncbi:NADH-ubiquinone oxidoreductase-F iron-sulfur binding region domain-containing protein [Aquisalimonas sp.]|uniref:NADH-ubiquinone oxidoreductase-F iron-sulfur binding region domain-containing protein n=1 Tax=Aquisalimonas sp. TaxID=1872621 RepID=UPI0025BC875D|nr:NADH-ubiquinone oxidoreductase-F iron-sulfur binding region domain-containing protein [Aquisalimonas sp.]